MSVEVVTVWVPRPDHPKWREDYIDLIELQRQTAHHFGHTHIVVTDSEGRGKFERLICNLPQSVMKAMLAGVLERLARPVTSDLVFLDCDALIGKDLSEAFDCSFDLGLTRRLNKLAPINNGAVYVPQQSVAHADSFFRRALDICGDHWGADQEAISQIAAPVPEISGTIENRGGTRIAFLSMKTHNAIPKYEGKLHRSLPFVIHFKGQTKIWAQTYAEKFIL